MKHNFVHAQGNVDRCQTCGVRYWKDDKRKQEFECFPYAVSGMDAMREAYNAANGVMELVR